MHTHSTTPAEFWAKVHKTDSCWIWQGYISTLGYGVLHRTYAHRLAYELLIGPIPKGLVIDHLCRVRQCVNPAHMEPVTIKENVIRGNVHSNGQDNLAKTHCPSGHPYDLFNTVRGSKGERKCRECHRLYMIRYHQHHAVA